MVRKLAGWLGLTKTITKFQVIEVEKPRKVGELNEESRKALVTLHMHPGFVYLMAKLGLQRNFLESQLKARQHATLADVQLLQSGIHWIQWLENEVDKEVNKVEKVRVDPTQEELKVFEQFRKNIEFVVPKGD